ncbi:MAG: MFS transporter [Candidatus Sumerlaeia bacterium]|nr:MFS transporter [Candidatus Sumerlaeia bacterium]
MRETISEIPKPSLEDPRKSGIQRWSANTFNALGDRNYRYFFAGLGISFTGAWMRRTALGWIVFQMTGSYELLGATFAMAALPLLVFAPLAGSLADSMDKRRLIIIARCFAFLISLSLGLLVWSGNATPTLLIALAFLGGTAFAFEVPTRQSFVVEIVGRDRLLNAIALNSALINLTRVIGPILAGFIMAWLGASMVFFLDAACSLIVIGTLSCLRLKPRTIIPSTLGRLGQMAEGWREVFRNKAVRNMLIMLACFTTFGWSFDTLMPAIAQEQLNLKEAQYGVLMGIFGLGAILGALFVAGRTDRARPKLQAYGGVSVMMVGLILMTLTRNYWLMMPCLALAGLGGITFLSTANTTIQLSIDDAIRGRVMGIWTLVFGGAMPLGSWLAGQTAALISPFATIQLFVGIWFVVTVAIFWWGNGDS